MEFGEITIRLDDRTSVFGYIGNTFIPWLKSHNNKFPVLLLIDGHRSHLTLNVCRLCEDNYIILYSLLPNATHIIQPLDVSVFRALKSGRKVTVDNWKEKSDNRLLTRAKFPQLFESVVNEKATPNVGYFRLILIVLTTQSAYITHQE